jgi:hypothetical protein
VRQVRALRRARSPPTNFIPKLTTPPPGRPAVRRTSRGQAQPVGRVRYQPRGLHVDAVGAGTDDGQAEIRPRRAAISGNRSDSRSSAARYSESLRSQVSQGPKNGQPAGSRCAGVCPVTVGTSGFGAVIALVQIHGLLHGVPLIAGGNSHERSMVSGAVYHPFVKGR